MKPQKKKKILKDIGGQAVIEGVMMRAPSAYAVAVRQPNNEIVVWKERLTPLKEKFPPFKLPVLRGFAALVESLVLGMKALTYSANQATVSNEKSQKSHPYSKQLPKEMGNLAIAFTILLSIGIAIALFVIIPERLASLVTEKGFAFNVVDGFIRLAVFLLYILVISRNKYIARIFEYHGAEHKSIHAYEASEELTEENVSKYSPLHPRCGTAFLLTVMVVSIFVFSVFGKPESVLVRIGMRLILIPVIAGISYEVIKISSRNQSNIISRLVILPGLWLQRLTTKEPSKDQIQVAIRSLMEVLEMEEGGSEPARPSC